MKMTLEIVFGNDTMKTLHDAKDAIVATLNRYGRDNRGTRADVNGADGGKILDENGNAVGFWEISE